MSYGKKEGYNRKRQISRINLSCGDKSNKFRFLLTLPALQLFISNKLPKTDTTCKQKLKHSNFKSWQK